MDIASKIEKRFNPLLRNYFTKNLENLDVNLK